MQFQIICRKLRIFTVLKFFDYGIHITPITLCLRRIRTFY